MITQIQTQKTISLGRSANIPAQPKTIPSIFTSRPESILCAAIRREKKSLHEYAHSEVWGLPSVTSLGFGKSGAAGYFSNCVHEQASAQQN